MNMQQVLQIDGSKILSDWGNNDLAFRTDDGRRSTQTIITLLSFCPFPLETIWNLNDTFFQGFPTSRQGDS